MTEQPIIRQPITEQPITQQPMDDSLLTDSEWLRRRIVELAPADPSTELETATLRELGLQSVDFVVLLAEIEQRLGTPLEDEDLDDENFADLPALDRLLGRVRGRHG